MHGTMNSFAGVPSLLFTNVDADRPLREGAIVIMLYRVTKEETCIAVAKVLRNC